MNAASRPGLWSTTTKAIVVVGLLLVLLALAVVLREMIPPLILAAILAYLLAPLSRALEKRFRLGRGWTAALMYALLVVFLAAARGVLIPIIIVGVFAGAIVAGVLGVVLAAPLIATGRVAWRFLLVHLYDGGRLPSAAAAEGNG